MTRESVNQDTLEKPKIADRRRAAGDRAFLPFEVRANQSVPDFLPIGHKVPVRQTSSTHGTDGYITTDQIQISRTQNRLKAKLEAAVAEFSFYEMLPAEKSETLLICYGVTARAAKAVYRELKNSAHPVSLLILKTLWPVPQQMIQRAAKDFKRVVVVEMNLGQYVGEIYRILADKHIDFYGQMDGRLITPLRIKEKIIDG